MKSECERKRVRVRVRACERLLERERRRLSERERFFSELLCNLAAVALDLVRFSASLLPSFLPPPQSLLLVMLLLQYRSRDQLQPESSDEVKKISTEVYRGRTTSDPLASATHKQATHVRQTHVSFFPSAQWHLTLSLPCVLRPCCLCAHFLLKRR